MRKMKTSQIVGIIAIAVLLSVALSSLFGVITKGFNDFDFRTVNEANKIKVDDYSTTLYDDKRADGLTVDVSEHGEITISGENMGETDIIIDVVDVTLDFGRYNLSSGTETDDDTYYLQITDGTTTVVADLDDESILQVTEDGTSYSVQIVVKAGEKINTTFKPVLVEGSHAEEFFN